MRAYLDTSAVVKLLISEAGSEDLTVWLDAALLASSRVTFVEAHAAIARREREATSSRAACAMARDQFRRDWPAYTVVDVTAALSVVAADFAETFGLRGFDAVQLASAHAVQTAVPGPMSFIAFDRRLNRAAKLLGLDLPAWALQ